MHRLEDPSPLLPTAYATTAAGRVTLEFDASLDEAAPAALDAMLTWLQHDLALGRAEALSLASVAVDLRVTRQVQGARTTSTSVNAVECRLENG
jgi:acetamidase/formamidase